MGNKAWHIVYDMFDKMHKQDHLEYTIGLTLFSLPVFIIYKTNLHSKKKGFIVVDIWKLNDLVLPDFYLLLLQSKIIANI